MDERFRKALFLVLFTITAGSLVAQQKPAYRIFKADGARTSYGKMLQRLKDADLVFFGELHNNAIAHWLELELAMDLSAYRALQLGAEMFETDDQQHLDRYLRGEISARGLDSVARLWKNYPTDYAPLVNFARSKKLSFIATNVPRRYASMVAKGGWDVLDTLPTADKRWIPPLPIIYDSTLPGYRNMLQMMQGHGGIHIPKAQALKDATMAWSILRNFDQGQLFLHYNGSYHSENHEGIVWYVRKARPGMKIITLAVVTQSSLTHLQEDNKRKADYIICVDEDVTNTY